MILNLVALLVLRLMCGSELNVALFSHPVLKRQPLETHVLVRSSLAALFGLVMPFWMAGSAILNLLLLLPFEHLTQSAWRLAAITFTIQVVAVVFSLVAGGTHQQPDWTAKSLPQDWSTQEHCWDIFHFVRTCGLIRGFAFLALSFRAR